MDRIDSIQAFIRVAESGSFTRAGDQLGISRSTVSKLIASLEAEIGIRLLNRTTRQVHLSPEGQNYLIRVRRALEELDAAALSIRRDYSQLSGRLWVQIPTCIGRPILIPRLEEFRSLAPRLELFLASSDRHIDLFGEGVDCAIQVGELPDSDYIAHPLEPLRQWTCIAPSLLGDREPPNHPSELSEFPLLQYFFPGKPVAEPFCFRKNGQTLQLKVQRTLAFDDDSMLLAAGLNGLGVLQISTHAAGPHVAKGELIRLCPDWDPPSYPVHLLTPSLNRMPTRVRAFTDWITNWKKSSTTCPKAIPACPIQ